MKYKRILFCSDLHGDQQDPHALRAFYKFSEAWKPDVRIFGGDLIDLRALRKGAHEDEKRESMRSDVEAGQRFLREWRPQYFLRGNHDERLWDLAKWGCGFQQDYALRGVDDFNALCQRLKIQMLPYHKREGVLRIGKDLIFSHGFFSGDHATKRMAETYATPGVIVHGHNHYIQRHDIKGLSRRTGMAAGCLCLLDMPYNSRQPGSLAQSHGWVYGVLNDKTGDSLLWQAEKTGDQWLLPSDIKAL